MPVSPSEGRRGIIFDMAARGDAQSHAEYARRMFDWELAAADAERSLLTGDFFERAMDRRAIICTSSTQIGRRVTKRDLDFDGSTIGRRSLSAG